MGDNLLWVKSSKLWWNPQRCADLIFAHAVIVLSFTWKDGAQKPVDNEKWALCYKNIIFEKRKKKKETTVMYEAVGKYLLLWPMHVCVHIALFFIKKALTDADLKFHYEAPV